MTYQTAANLALFPENSEEDVIECARLLNVDLNRKFALV